MRLVSTTITPKLRLGFLLLLGSFTAGAQANSPYSRYGLGDMLPGQHIVSRALGGVSAAYRDVLGQSVNFNNPATYSAIPLVTYDIGISIDRRTLRSADPIKKFNSTDFTPSYVVLGVPLGKKKNLKTNISQPNFGMVFGLKPVTRINYSILENARLPEIDSITTLYEGDGGLYQAFVGMGKRWGGLSLGFNAGYNFGRKETNTRRFFNSDSVSYASGNVSTVSSFNKLFLSGGMQYQFNTGKNSVIRIGLDGNLKQKLSARQDVTKETFFYDVNGVVVQIDSVLVQNDKKGSITLPASYTAGIAFETFTNQGLSRMMVSAEYESTQWSNYSFFGQPDKVMDNWHLRFGAQLSPDYLKALSFWSRLTYRAGAFYGRDYINADNNELKEYGITLGLGLPVLGRSSYSKQSSIIHTAFEFGKRGSQVNNITENFFRFSVGFSLSDVWFIKRRYE